MVADDDIKAAVTAATRIRRAMLSPVEFDAVVQFVRGKLRRARSALPVEQVGLAFTDLLLDGRRNTPPNPYRPQLRQLVRSVYETNRLPPPAGNLADVLVSVVAGFIADHSLPIIPAGRAVVIRDAVGLYLAGA